MDNNVETTIAPEQVTIGLDNQISSMLTEDQADRKDLQEKLNVYKKLPPESKA